MHIVYICAYYAVVGVASCLWQHAKALGLCPLICLQEQSLTVNSSLPHITNKSFAFY